MSNMDDLLTAFKGAMTKATDPVWQEVELLRTGILPVDMALCGGFAYGRISEVFGDWSTGKSMLLYEALAQNQKDGGISILFESEGAFTHEYFTSLGGDADNLLIRRITTVEDFFSGVEEICKVFEKGKKDQRCIIGWDSIAGTGTRKLQKDGLDVRDMTKAIVMSDGTKFIWNLIHKTNIGIISTNQTRQVIGSKPWEPTHTPGGRAWPYHCSQRVELRFDGGPKGSGILLGDMLIGRWIRGTVVKNRVGSPFKTFKLPLYTTEGLPHPVFPDRVTEMGVDRDEALMIWYLGNCEAVFGKERERFITPGAWNKLHPEITGGEEKRFRQKQWPEILEDYPQLKDMDFNPEG